MNRAYCAPHLPVHLQPDKGVKCPFCRAYIDGYRSLRG